MKNKVGIGLLVVIFIGFFILTNVLAQGQFVRKQEIPIPEATLNNGGTGGMISGVDLDKDGKKEIYLVNDNWNDTPTEVVPRIYKLELDGGNWNVVWQAVAPVEKQNTWPCLVSGDLDKDGKPEIIWGPVNNLSGVANLNPARILVYESAGDGSDVMGVSDGAGGYKPNAKWTITASDNINIRPMRWVVADPDQDDVNELIFAERAGRTGGYFFGVISVDKIPDNGDGSETWTLEVSGLDFSLLAGTTQNKWDVAVIGSNFYTFCEIEISKVHWDANSFAWQYTKLLPMKGGASVQSAQVVDLNKDGVQEIICAVYDWGNDAYKGIYLLQEDADTLKRTELVNMVKYWPSGARGPWGGAAGDIDHDGYLDFVFGSRASTPNAGIYNLSYRGGDITSPASYKFAMIDSMYADGGIWTVVNIADVDDDPEMEVLYTSSTDAGVFPNLGTKPIVVLDYVPPAAPSFDKLVVASEALVNGATTVGTGIRFKPGRYLDNGKTIWLLATNHTSGNRVSWILRSIDGGKTFTHNATSIPARGANMDAWDAQTAVVAQADGTIWRTEDGGVTWTKVYSYTIPPLGGSGFFDGLRVLNDKVAVAFGDMETAGQMHFVRTEDKGLTWTEISGIDYGTAQYANFTFGNAACNIGETMWVGITTSAYDKSWVVRTKDAGKTWQTFALPPDVFKEAPYSITFQDAMTGMMSFDGTGMVAKTTDGGETWTKMNKPDPAAECFVNAVVAVPNSNIIFGFDDIGIFYTQDLGDTWTKMDNPATPPLVPVTNYFYGGLFLNKDFGYIYAANGNIFRFENQLTGVSERPVENKPTDFVLNQNYPNPFNPVTTITFNLPTTQNVILKIYNLQGAEVKTLLNTTHSAGVHQVQWDGTDNQGQKVTSGIYFYSIQTPQQHFTKSMLLIK